jgi:hypothetical protein
MPVAPPAYYSSSMAPPVNGTTAGPVVSGAYGSTTMPVGPALTTGALVTQPAGVWSIFFIYCIF